MDKSLGFIKHGNALMYYRVEKGRIVANSGYYGPEYSYQSDHNGDLVKVYAEEDITSENFVLKGWKLVMEVEVAKLNSGYKNLSLVSSEGNSYAVTFNDFIDLFNSGMGIGSRVLLQCVKKGSEIRFKLLLGKEYDKVKEDLEPVGTVIKDRKIIELLKKTGLSKEEIKEKIKSRGNKDA